MHARRPCSPDPSDMGAASMGTTPRNASVWRARYLPDWGSKEGGRASTWTAWAEQVRMGSMRWVMPYHKSAGAQPASHCPAL